ncbi:MAG: AgmX/PglI C-terminal domain-containing protein [Myxococcota bacterium]|nr:AgmX/PglI C-terminal domain-containing protein [Myxococcota bacterium]
MPDSSHSDDLNTISALYIASQEHSWVTPSLEENPTEPREVVFSEYLRVSAQNPEQNIQHDASAQPYDWVPHESVNMRKLFEKIQEGEKIDPALLREAYLDMDRTGYQRYFQLSAAQSNVLQQKQDQRMRALLEENTPRERESAIGFVQRIIASIHASEGLRYQADLNSVTAYFANNKMQCQSATYLTALIWYQQAHRYPNAQWVFVKTPGHVKPGLVIDQKLYTMEALREHPLAIPDHPSVDATLLVTRGKEEIIDLLYRSAGHPSPYKESDLVLFRRGEAFDPVPSGAARAIPLSTIDLAQDEETIFERVLKGDNLEKVEEMSRLRFGSSPSESMRNQSVSSMLDIDFGLSIGMASSKTSLADTWSASKMQYRIRRDSSGEMLRLGNPTVLGGLDKRWIDAVIRKNLPQIRYCYKREQSKNPNIAGKVVVKFVIAKDGSVSKTRIRSTTLSSKAVESCILNRIKRFHFPKPSDGIVIVSYPFSFAHSGSRSSRR